MTAYLHACLAIPPVLLIQPDLGLLHEGIHYWLIYKLRKNGGKERCHPHELG